MGRGYWLTLMTVIVLVTGYSLRAPAPAAPGLAGGRLDLTGWRFTDQGPIRLAGTWKFYPYELLAPADLLRRRVSGVTASGPDRATDTEATAPITLPVPATWPLSAPGKGRGIGYGTYVLTIEGLADAGPGGGRLGLLQPPACSASRTYFFSADAQAADPVLRLGRTATTAAHSQPGQRTAITALEPGLSATKTYYLSIQVANFHHRLGGLCQNIYLGTLEQLSDLQFRHWIGLGFVISIVFSITVYAFTIYLYTPRNHSTLWLGLAALAATLYFWTRGNLWEHIHGMHGDWGFKFHYALEYGAMILAGPFLVNFYQHAHRTHYLPRRLLRGNIGLAVILCATVIAAPTHGFTRHITLLMGFALIQLAAAVYILLRGVRDGQPHSNPLLFSLLPLFLTLPLDFASALQRVDRTTYTEAAVVFFTIIHCLIQGQRLRAAIQRSSHLSDSLAEEVRQQTASLEEKNYELLIARTALEEANRDLKALSITDGLTGAYNRLYFDRQFLIEWQRSRRERLPLSLVLVDIDHFKQLNDNHGHLAGDTGLKNIVAHMRAVFQRASDAVCRYGGEEFVVLLPNTPPEQAAVAAEKLRQLVEATPMRYNDSPVGFTVSIGVGGLVPEPDHQPLDLLAATDQALYRVKRGGRNGVHIATVPASNIPA